MEDVRERAGRELLALPPPPGDGPGVVSIAHRGDEVEFVFGKLGVEASATAEHLLVVIAGDLDSAGFPQRQRPLVRCG